MYTYTYVDIYIYILCTHIHMLIKEIKNDENFSFSEDLKLYKTHGGMRPVRNSTML